MCPCHVHFSPFVPRVWTYFWGTPQTICMACKTSNEFYLYMHLFIDYFSPQKYLLFLRGNTFLNNWFYCSFKWEGTFGNSVMQDVKLPDRKFLKASWKISITLLFLKRNTFHACNELLIFFAYAFKGSPWGYFSFHNWWIAEFTAPKFLPTIGGKKLAHKIFLMWKSLYSK